MKSRSIAVIVALMLAVAATLVIFLYVQGVRRTTTTENKTLVAVIVSKKDIAPGTKLNGLIDSGDFTTLRIPAGAVVEGAVTDLSQLKDQTARFPILQGEQISVARLEGGSVRLNVLNIPKGYQAVTFALEIPQAVGGVLDTGDHVAVYASFDDVSVVTGDLKKVLSGQGTTKKVDLGDYTLTIVPDVQILKVEQPAGAAGIGNSSNSAYRVTFALLPIDAENFIQANAKGSVWLALLPPNEPGQPVEPANIIKLLLAAATRQVAA